VGSGTGSLTCILAREAGAVLSIEIDPAFFELAQEAILDADTVRLLHADALRNKNNLNPGMLDALEALRLQFGCTQRKLVANLPYAVATPVISNLLLSDYPFERMVVTVQWEIAERLLAKPATKEYSSLAVLVQSLAHVELVRQLPPTVFWPRPKVDSAFVLIKPDEAKRRHVGDVGKFRVFLRDLYTHRRKNLRGALTGWPSGRKNKVDVDRKLEELGIDGTIRAENLDLEDHLRLCRAFSE
jgi:16S rRNA (adenine1518-N6/adenine1519-N6)-dimethyltransferase